MSGEPPDDCSPGQIEIFRETGVRVDAWRTWRIMVDGRHVDDIRAGERKTIGVHHGPHEVWLTTSRFWHSPIISIDVEPSQRMKLRCLPRASPQSLLYTLLYRRTQYIRLELVEEASIDNND